VNGKMKNKAIQKFSPFALGAIVLISQMAHGSMAYGASLNTVAATDNSLLKPNVSELQPSTSAIGGSCAKAPAGNGSLTNSSVSTVSGKNLKSSETLDSSSVLASSMTGSVVPSSIVASTPISEPAGASNLSSDLVAQVPALDDCCEIGGTTTCEVGGLPPVGGGALPGGLSPLAALGALPALGLIPLLGGGGDGNNGGTTPPPPVPEPSSTAAITAGLGLLGLWYGRRYRASHKASL
jgi:hypothetical protein